MGGYKLFPIPMQGQGTADVESLPSYLFRSAYSHGVSIGILLQVIREFDADSSLPMTRNLAGKLGVETLARVNRLTWALRRRLAEITGQNMSCEPLSFLNRQVYCISTEITGFRWCPECLAEMEGIGSPPYIKQLWHMTAIIHCPLHRTPLLSKCEYCWKSQDKFMTNFPLGWCFDCGATLSRRKNSLSEEDIEPSWQCLSNDIVEIFERTARPEESKNDWFNSRYFVLAMSGTTGYKGRNSHISKDLKLLLEKYGYDWKANCRLISLRRLAYLMHMSLYELLTSSGKPYQLPIDPVNLSELPKHLEKRKKIARNHGQEYQKILDLLEKQTTPPSLKQLARMARVSVGYLEYRFPSLVRKVVDSYQLYLLQQSLVRRYRAQAAALKFFTNEQYASHVQSRKEAYRVLSRETGLPKWVLKDAIQVAYSVLK